MAGLAQSAVLAPCVCVRKEGDEQDQHEVVERAEAGVLHAVVFMMQFDMTGSLITCLACLSLSCSVKTHNA